MQTNRSIRLLCLQSERAQSEVREKEEALKKAEDGMRALQVSVTAKDQNIAALSGKVSEGNW